MWFPSSVSNWRYCLLLSGSWQAVVNSEYSLLITGCQEPSAFYCYRWIWQNITHGQSQYGMLWSDNRRMDLYVWNGESKIWTVNGYCWPILVCLWWKVQTHRPVLWFGRKVQLCIYSAINKVYLFLLKVFMLYDFFPSKTHCKTAIDLRSCFGWEKLITKELQYEWTSCHACICLTRSFFQHWNMTKILGLSYKVSLDFCITCIWQGKIVSLSTTSPKTLDMSSMLLGLALRLKNFFHAQLNWAWNFSCSEMLKCQQFNCWHLNIYEPEQ